MITTVNVQQLIDLDETIPVIDVRTPAEFANGHIHNAFNIPLFSNEERAQVGTIYKQVGREQAILLGFDLSGPKWSGFIKQALEISPQKKVAVHCWRGGMRSGAMGWALSLYGFQVHLLEGGYKKYRKWVLSQFDKPYKLHILGGFTGCGKTHMLSKFKAMGQQVIDLEDLAQHQGSSYGSMGRLLQPSQEQFENNLATELYLQDCQKPIWIEDESNTIGKLFVPIGLFGRMRKAHVIKLEVHIEQRISSLTAEYGKLDKQFLIESTQRIHKRIGPEQTKHAIAAINEGHMEDFIRIVLVYYDKTYKSGLAKREPLSVHPIEMSKLNEINKLIEFAESISETIDHNG